MSPVSTAAALLCIPSLCVCGESLASVTYAQEVANSLSEASSVWRAHPPAPRGETPTPRSTHETWAMYQAYTPKPTPDYSTVDGRAPLIQITPAPSPRPPTHAPTLSAQELKQEQATFRDDGEVFFRTKFPTDAPSPAPTPRETMAPHKQKVAWGGALTPPPTPDMYAMYLAHHPHGQSMSPTKAPTASPTAGPTQIPTAIPTSSPSPVPTPNPIMKKHHQDTSELFDKGPSKSGIFRLRKKQTVGPTPIPVTYDDSYAKALVFTVAPTKAPVAQPTAAPSAVPTAAPTPSPTPRATMASFRQGKHINGLTQSPTPPSPSPTPSPTPSPSLAPTPAPTDPKPTPQPPTPVPPTMTPTPAPTEVIRTAYLRIAAPAEGNMLNVYFNSTTPTLAFQVRGMT